MFDLNERVRTFLADVRGIPPVSPESRSRVGLADLSRRGAELWKAVQQGKESTTTALLRNALAEEGNSIAIFEQLDVLTEVEHSLSGAVPYAEAVFSFRDGKQQVARARFESAVFLTSDELAVDILKCLTSIHKTSDRRTNFHAVQGLLYQQPGAMQDLERAGNELREALSLDPGNLLAHLAYASLLERHGDRANRLLALEKVLALAPPGRNRIADRAYETLVKSIAECTSFQEIAQLADSILAGALGFEAERGEALATAFAHPAIADDRAKLVKRLLQRVEAVATPEKRIDDPYQRSLLATQAARLRALISLHAVGGLEEADRMVEDGEIESRTRAHGTDFSKPVMARALAELWQRKLDGLLSGRERDGDAKARMDLLVRAQDRVVRWASEAVESGPPTDAEAPRDLTRLLALLARMHATISTEPATPEGFAAMIPSETLAASLEPVLKCLFLHLQRTDRRWSDLSSLAQLDEIVRALCIGNKMTEFAIGEMSANAYERLLRIGGSEEQVHARLRLAQIYLDQHRYDLAAQHAQKAVEQDPRSSEAPYLLGTIYLKSGKRLLAVERLRDAAERFAHPEAAAALAEDCARDDQPHLGAQYAINAVENLIKSDRKLSPRDFELMGEWLRKARKYNGDVEPFNVVIDKGLPRKERKEKQKELETLNGTRMGDKKLREERIALLFSEYERMKGRGKR